MIKKILLTVIILVFSVSIVYGDTFEDSDLQGDWLFKGKWLTTDYEESLSNVVINFNSDGYITDGKVREITTFQEDDSVVLSTANVDGNFGSMSPNGRFSAVLTTSGGLGPYELQGIMNEDKNFIVGIETLSSSNRLDYNLNYLTKVNTGTTYSDADVNGSWNLKGTWASGSITADGSGNVTDGYWTSLEGKTVNVTGGTYTINSTYGEIDLDIETDTGTTYELTGVMNGNKDFISSIRPLQITYPEVLNNPDFNTSEKWGTTGSFDVTTGAADYDYLKPPQLLNEPKFYSFNSWSTAVGEDDYNDFEYTHESVKFSIPENLSQNSFFPNDNWSTTSDFEIANDNKARYSYSTGSGTLTQATGSLAKTLENGVWYEFTYTVSDYNAAAPATGEVLSSGDFTDTAVWSAEGDFSLNSAADYVDSTGSGAISQSESNLNPQYVLPNTAYEFTYEITNFGTGTDDKDPKAYITTSFANEQKELTVTSGTHTVTFTSGSDPGKFVVSGTSSDGGDQFTLDNLSLKPTTMPQTPPTAEITSGVASSPKSLKLSGDGTYSIKFKSSSSAASANFEISASSDATGDKFTLDDVSLKRTIGSGALVQAETNFTNEATADSWYQFTYNVIEKTGSPEVVLTTDFASSEVDLNMGTGTHTVTFKSLATGPGDFKIAAFAESAQDSFIVDDFALQRANSTGTLTQQNADFSVKPEDDSWYQLQYTVSNVGGNPTAKLTPDIVNTDAFTAPDQNLQLNVASSGTHSFTFKSSSTASNQDFEITATSDSEDDQFTLDKLSLKKQEFSEKTGNNFHISTLIKSIGSGSTNAAFSGTWDFMGDFFKGTIVSDGKGNILGGRWEPAGGEVESISRGKYSINEVTGGIEAQIYIKAASGEEQKQNFHCIMNESKEIMSCTIPPVSWSEGMSYDFFTFVKNYSKEEAVGASGGKVEVTNSYDNLYKVYVDIPADALSSTKNISIDEVTNFPSLPSTVTHIGHVVDFGPTGLSFDKEVTVALTYPEGASEGVLKAYKYDSSNEVWKEVSIDNVDNSNNRVLIKTDSSSIYALGTTEPPPTPEAKNIFGYSDGAGTCFIATATYGTPSSEEVKTLCKFRDKYLIPNPVGRKFVDLYYQYSPPIASFIKDKKILKKGIRVVLRPLIWYSKYILDLGENSPKNSKD